MTPMTNHITIVLGAAVLPNGRASATLTRRALAGAEHWHNNGGVIVVTGGVGPDPNLPSEASVAADICLKQGVPMDAILHEDTSRNTFENITETLVIRPDLKSANVTLVSDRWHLPRARLIARIMGIKTRGYAAAPGRLNRTLIAIGREVLATPLSVVRAVRYKP